MPSIDEKVFKMNEKGIDRGMLKSDESASRVIQSTWRTVKLKRQLSDDFHSTYCALSNVSFKEDPRRMDVSFIMLGQRQAACHEDDFCKKNPYLKNPQAYFRYTQLNNFSRQGYQQAMYSSLGGEEQFREITEEASDLSGKKSVIKPIRVFLTDIYATTPLDELVNKYCPTLKPYIGTKKSIQGDLTICYIREGGNENDINTLFCPMLVSAGVLGSPWRFFSHIQPEHALISSSKLYLPSSLPQTKKDLLQGSLYQSLVRLLDTMTRFPSTKAPTYHLMRALKSLVLGMPELNPAATQRIAYMLKIAHDFYRQNYIRYAQYIYAIVHEISLELFSQQNNIPLLDEQFNQFLVHAKETCYTLLNMSENDGKWYFNTTKKQRKPGHTLAWDVVSVLANSGSHAYSIAILLAHKANTGQANKIYIAEPFYFELKQLNNTHYTTNRSEANIHVISTGCDLLSRQDRVVQVSGVDLNQYIEQFCQTKDSIVLVDMSTALYETLRLGRVAKQLLQQGRLSIIIFESLQKFGLLHTDQAQAGRVLALCSKNHFMPKDLEILKKRARIDFHQKIDLRIAHFINQSCHDILDDIRQQHYKNARLIQHELALYKVIKKQDDSKFFFIVFSEAWRDVLAKLATANLVAWIISSGKAISNISPVSDVLRFSAHASDEIDSRIWIAYFFLAHNAKKPEWRLPLVQNAQPGLLDDSSDKDDVDARGPTNAYFSIFFKLNKSQLTQWLFNTVFQLNHTLTLQEQIFVIVVMHFFVCQDPTHGPADITSLTLIIPFVLEKCFLLKGRDLFSQIKKKYDLSHSNIAKDSIARHLLTLERLLSKHRPAHNSWFATYGIETNGLDLLADTYEIVVHKNQRTDPQFHFYAAFNWDRSQAGQWFFDMVFNTKEPLFLEQQILLITITKMLVFYEEQCEKIKKQASFLLMTPFVLEKCPLLKNRRAFFELELKYTQLDFTSLFNIDNSQSEQWVLDMLFLSDDKLSLQQQILLVTVLYFMTSADSSGKHSSFFLVKSSILARCPLLQGTALFLQVEQAHDSQTRHEMDRHMLAVDFLLTYRSILSDRSHSAMMPTQNSLISWDETYSAYKQLEHWRQINHFEQPNQQRQCDSNDDKDSNHSMDRYFSIFFKSDPKQLRQWLFDNVFKSNNILSFQDQIVLIVVMHYCVFYGLKGYFYYESILLITPMVLEKCFLLKDKNIFNQINKEYELNISRMATDTIGHHLLVLKCLLTQRADADDWLMTDASDVKGLDILNDTNDIVMYPNKGSEHEFHFFAAFNWDRIQSEQWIFDMAFKVKEPLFLNQQMLLITLVDCLITHEERLEQLESTPSFLFMIPVVLEKCSLLKGRAVFVQLENKYHRTDFFSILNIDKTQLEPWVLNQVFVAKDNLSLQQQIFLITVLYLLMSADKTSERSSFFLVTPLVLKKCGLLQGTAYFLQVKQSYDFSHSMHASNEIEHRTLVLNFLLTYRSLLPDWSYSEIESSSNGLMVLDESYDVYNDLDHWSQLNLEQKNNDIDFLNQFKPNKMQLKQWVTHKVKQTNSILSQQQQIFLMTVVHFLVSRNNKLYFDNDESFVFSVLPRIANQYVEIGHTTIFMQVTALYQEMQQVEHEARSRRYQMCATSFTSRGAQGFFRPEQEKERSNENEMLDLLDQNLFAGYDD